MVEHLKSNMVSLRQVVHIEEISALNGKYVKIPCQLPGHVKLALNRVGITRLYCHQDRRKIESDFFNSNVCGIAATNALELGIDVGEIDVTLHLGFPGCIASLWQQAGRSGRREKHSLAIYVAFEGPLDQYLIKFPHKLFRGVLPC